MIINTTYKQGGKGWRLEWGWGWGGETNSSVLIFKKKKRQISNQVAPLDYKSSLECWADAKGIKQTWRGRKNGADKVSGYGTRDVSLPYDLMWVSAGCAHSVKP